MFKKLEGDIAILRENGVYKLSELYEWGGDLYLKYGSGFIRVYSDGKTTKANVFLESLTTEVLLYKDRFGRVSLSQHKGYLPLTFDNDGLLVDNREIS